LANREKERERERYEEEEMERSELSGENKCRVREGWRGGGQVWAERCQSLLNNGRTSVWDYCPGSTGDIIICCTGCRNE